MVAFDEYLRQVTAVLKSIGAGVQGPPNPPPGDGGGGGGGGGGELPDFSTVDIGNGITGIVDSKGQLIDWQWPKTSSGGGGGGPTDFDWARLAQDNTQFGARLTQDQQQFLARLGIDQGQLDLQSRQADRAYGLDAAQFGYNIQRDLRQDKQSEEEFKYRMASDALDRSWRDKEAQAEKARWDAQYALQIGDQKLAAKRQADSVALQRQSMQLQAQAQQASAAADMARAQAAMAGVEAQREGNQMQFELGKESNVIDRERIAQQLGIAQMDDATRRMLGLQSNQTGQFAAETDRAAQLGRLGLDEKQFILDKATQARNLPALFFMQRGVAPDWDAIMAGGAPPVASSVAMGPDGTVTGPNAGPVGGPSVPLEDLPQLPGGPLAPNTEQYTPTTPAPVFSGAAAPPPPPPTPQATGAPPVAEAPAPTPDGAVTGEGEGIDEEAAREAAFAEARAQLQAQQAEHRARDRERLRTRGPKKSYIQRQFERAGLNWGYQGGVFDGPAIVGDDPRGRDRSREELVTPTMTPDGRPAINVQPLNREGLAAQMRLMGSGGPIPRFAAGTNDYSEAYRTAGMGGQYVPTSNNSYANASGATMPKALAALAAYGYPVNPALLAGMTGGVAPGLNVAGAVGSMGGGTMQSLQSFNRATRDEQDELRGVLEGTVGVPWDTIQQGMQAGTTNLRRAVAAR